MARMAPRMGGQSLSITCSMWLEGSRGAGHLMWRYPMSGAITVQPLVESLSRPGVRPFTPKADSQHQFAGEGHAGSYMHRVTQRPRSEKV